MEDDYIWIPFSVIACSSEEYGTEKELLVSQKQSDVKSWESSRTGSFPVEFIIQFKFRSEINHIVISSKKEKPIPFAKFQIGDGLKGSFIDAEYRECGQSDLIENNPLTIKLQGIGNYLKIIITKKPTKTPGNPFQQVSLSLIKIWGKYTNYLTRIQNTQIPLAQDKQDVDKLLIGLGIPIDLISQFESDLREWEHSSIDEDTRTTLRDMLRMKDQALYNQDFQALHALAEDTKKVFDIGQQLYQIKRDLNLAIAKEDFSVAMNLKDQFRKLEKKRDEYDALYQTSRFENMIAFDTSDSEYYKQYLKQLDKEAEAEEERQKLEKQLQRQRELELIQREQLHKVVMVEEPIVYEDNERQIQGQADSKPWWEKVDGQDVKDKSKKKKGKKEEKKQDDEEIQANYNNPFAYNEGDDDLNSYFQPLLSKTGDHVPEMPSEIFRRLHNLGYLTVFGAKIWSCINSENWRLREAALQAVLNFIEMPLLKKYQNGKSKKLFLACMEMVKLGIEDKVLSIYFTSLKLLTTALVPPICGTDVAPKLIVKVLSEFTPTLINKISEMNSRARDISMHTILSIHKHPAAQIGDLIKSCLQLCIQDPNFASLYVSPDKQPERIMLSRLEIVLSVIQDQGLDDKQWLWQDAFVYLCVPCLFHASNEVRMYSVEIIVSIYQLVGEEVRQGVMQVDMKPNMLKLILEKMDRVKIDADKNQEIRDNQLKEQGLIPNKSAGHLKQILEERPSKSQQQKREEKLLEEQMKQKGIVFSLDAIIAVKESKYPFHGWISLNPPAVKYEKQPLNETVELVSKLDWESPRENPNFDSTLIEFSGQHIQPSTTFIIEIASCDITAKVPKLIPGGWTIMPLYKENGDINQGAFQLPLFSGEVPKEIISSLRKEPDQWGFMMKKLAEGKKSGVVLFEYVSVIIRMSEYKKRNELGNTFQVEQLEPYQFIPVKELKRYKYDAEKEKKAVSGKKLLTILPSKEKPEDFQIKIDETLNKLYNLEQGSQKELGQSQVSNMNKQNSQKELGQSQTSLKDVKKSQTSLK